MSQSGDFSGIKVEMGLPTSDLNSVFWIASGTMVFTFLGLAVKYAYKSKCTSFSCCCFMVERDIESEKVEDLEEMKTKKIPLETI